jgi:uncharacterized membrane protein
MMLRWRSEIPHLLLLAGMFVLAALAWDGAPDAIPVHWNLAGEVDRYGGKAEGLLALPIIALVVYLLLLVAPRLASATRQQPGSLYTAARFAVLLLLAIIYGLILLILNGVPIEMERAVPMLVGILLVAIGSVMGRVQPNALMGIRTPWTLVSMRSWTASQRLGGWLFVASGALLALGGVLGSTALFIGAMVLLAVGTIGLMVYGYWICRSDPDRLPAGETLLTPPGRG